MYIRRVHIWTLELERCSPPFKLVTLQTWRLPSSEYQDWSANRKTCSNRLVNLQASRKVQLTSHQAWQIAALKFSLFPGKSWFIPQHNQLSISTVAGYCMENTLSKSGFRPTLSQSIRQVKSRHIWNTASIFLCATRPSLQEFWMASKNVH